MKVLPKRIVVCEVLYFIGVILLIISQFTGLYYTFDEQNTYSRSPYNSLCYLVPFLIVILQQTMVFQFRDKLSRPLTASLMLNTIVPLLASIVQIFVYGISLTNMTIVGMMIILYIYALVHLNQSLNEARESEMNAYKEVSEREHILFEQTAEALASAIDAKDRYTHGHSARVAMYSRQIAKEAGKSEEECERVYFAALLHDVGKIGVSDEIIRKNGKLTDEEYSEIKMHPVYGNQILSTIQESPYLSIGANYHHERYDGKGYPERLVGEDIPEIARIIAVADAYDAMTSIRSYRDIIPQHKVREELVKGSGTQFDPKFAKIMLHMLDHDINYSMHEDSIENDSVIKTRLKCDRLFHDCSTGIIITNMTTHISLFYKGDEGIPEENAMPCLVAFDALDGRVHETKEDKKELMYMEYAQMWFDGEVIKKDARKVEAREYPVENPQYGSGTLVGFKRYDIEAVRFNDHVRIRISDDKKTIETIIALPDNTRYSYISITGENCVLSNIHIDQRDDHVDENTIPRIVEEISYIKGLPEGDIPNIQVDGWREKTTAGIPIDGEMHLKFHAFSLPTARLVWHCPFICIYTSKDGTVDADDFLEYVLIRLDGESWESNLHAENKFLVDRTLDFEDWNVWKEKNKKGMDCEAVIRREGNVITVSTENFGINIKCTTTLKDEPEKVYFALTGDQCAITDIHVE
ncbi:MAG: HD domain-containing protein [Eubacterium sp.]|nr:HD domain-containing protein [Eubacterium sp.]